MKARVLVLTCIVLVILGVVRVPSANALSMVFTLTSSESLTLLCLGCGLLFLSRQARKLKRKSTLWHIKILGFQHFTNPLHFHCRLVKYGMGKGMSISISRLYELTIFGWINWISVKVDGFVTRHLMQSFPE